MEFKKAKSVWAKDYLDEKNIQLVFKKTFHVTENEIGLDDYRIYIAVNNHYRIFVNGTFVVYGPQRCCKGYFRMDGIDLNKYMIAGENILIIEAIYYNIAAFSYVSQDPMIQIELRKNDTVLFYTDANNNNNNDSSTLINISEGNCANRNITTGISMDNPVARYDSSELFNAVRQLSRHQKVQRYSYQRPFIECYSLPALHSEFLELCAVSGGGLLDRGVPYPDFNKAYAKTLLKTGVVQKNEPVAPHVNYHGFNVEVEKNGGYRQDEMEDIYTDSILNLRTVSMKDIREKLDSSKWISLEENEFHLFELEIEKTGFIKFDLSVTSECDLYVLFDEVLSGDDINFMRLNTACVIPLFCKQTEETFMSFEAHSMKYIKILCLKGRCKIKNLCLVEYANPDTKRATFESDDPALNRIFMAAKETFAQNSPDIFMDCPSRERAGWLCDSFFTARVEKVLTGSSYVEHDFLENFILPDKFPNLPEGVLPMCYPSDSLKSEFIPNWVMWYVIELAEYFERTGDRDLIERSRDRVYSILNYFDRFIGKYGMLEKLESWVFVEWSKANDWVQDINYPTNMLYAMVLEKVGGLYSERVLTDRSKKMKEKIIELSYNGVFFTDHAHLVDGELIKANDISETCQYYAFFTKVATKERFPGILRIIIEDFGPGRKCAKTHPDVEPANAFIGNYLRLEVLSSCGHKEHLMDEIKEYFDYMAIRTGTLWENDTPCASCNHGFASHVAVILYRDVLGIDNAQCLNGPIEWNDAGIPLFDCVATIPVGGKCYCIVVKNGKRSIDLI